jgi:hypothetical protein
VVVSDLPGDYDQNGVVDEYDYTVWRDHLGEMFTLPGENPAAATPDLVDQEDYDFWKANFGTILGSGAVSVGLSAAEPATSVLLLAATVFFTVRSVVFTLRVKKIST